ncbi:Uncharacterised protein [uncultured Clostridium sp.]|nr:Uncharacterised protein [uncultured Clostridium sp.]SCJ08071.1 Uncharacterised protein [uncultured Clostridium sp.]
MNIKRLKVTGFIILICLVILSFMSNIGFRRNLSVDLNKKIKQAFIEELRDNETYKWSRYDSEKWVNSYKILNINQLGYKTYNIDVEFILKDLSGRNSMVKDNFIIDIK